MACALSGISPNSSGGCWCCSQSTRGSTVVGGGTEQRERARRAGVRVTTRADSAMEQGMETLNDFPDAVSAELVAMSDRKQMDSRLRELGITKLGRRAAVINAILIRQQASKVAAAPPPDESDDDGP